MSFHPTTHFCILDGKVWFEILLFVSGSSKGMRCFHENMMTPSAESVNGCPLSCWTHIRSWRKGLHIPGPRLKEPREILLKLSHTISAISPAHHSLELFTVVVKSLIYLRAWVLQLYSRLIYRGRNQEALRTIVRSLSLWSHQFVRIWDFLFPHSHWSTLVGHTSHWPMKPVSSCAKCEHT